MAFFEPERGDPSYPTYRRNFSKDQDEDDSSWHNLYKELWKALINTTKQRRIIQNDMCEAHPDGIDYMFEECGIEKSDKFTGEDIEYFLSQQLQTTYEPNFIRAVIQSLDNHQDGVVSYYEFLDAMYGAV